MTTNDVQLMTQEQVATFIRKEAGGRNDPFAHTADALLPYLSFEHAKEFLREGITEELWHEAQREAGENPEDPLTVERVTQAVRDYMPFAQDKALNHRGLSAGRSITKFWAWVSVLGMAELREFLERQENYGPYGAPMLAKICEVFDLPQPDSIAWRTMASGEEWNDALDG